MRELLFGLGMSRSEEEIGTEKLENDLVDTIKRAPAIAEVVYRRYIPIVYLSTLF